MSEPAPAGALFPHGPPGARARRPALPSVADRAIAVLARQRMPRALSYTVAVLVVIAAAALQTGLPLYHGPYLILFPAIIIIGLTLGVGEGLAATVVAAFLADYLFMGVVGRFQLESQPLVTSFFFVLFSGFIVVVCDAVRRAALRQALDLERGRALQAAAEASARALQASEEALRRLNDTLEARVAERTLALEEAQAALRQSQKMEALGQLTGGVAHDFNNLLAGVVGGLELARTRLGQGRIEDVPRYLTIAEDSARRGATLTRRLLAFSRRQSLALEALEVQPLVAGMEELIRRAVGPGVALELDLGEDGGVASADRGQLENAILNLAINARDAMGGRGALSLEVRDVVAAAPEAAVRAIAPGAYVRLAVRDTGCGMTAEVASRAFDPFFTTKPVGEGTGLGLSMVYAFARQAGGAAWIETAPGAGTTVVLLLRRACEAQPAAAAQSAPAGARSAEGRGETILILEDEAAIRTVVGEALEASGYRTLAAADGAACLEILGAQPAVDLLISDLGLPGALDGRQVFEAARTLRPSLKVLFITGYADAEAEAFLEPQMARLNKPFAMDTLRRAVADILHA